MAATECRNEETVDGVLCVCDKTTRNHRMCSGWHDGLGRHVDWENPDWTPPRTRDKDAAASTVHALASKVNGAQAAAEGSERAAGSWTPLQQMLVDAAISKVAEHLDEFTVDEVWAELGPDVPKTAGMAAMMTRAARKHLIEATDRYADSTRQDRADHDHGRRLRIWRSLMR